MRFTLHDVVSVGDETNADHSSDDTNLPQRNLGLLLGGAASGPSSVHTSPDTNSVTNIVVDMEAGHGGASGRFKRLEDAALNYAFMLDLAGIKK